MQAGDVTPVRVVYATRHSARANGASAANGRGLRPCVVLHTGTWIARASRWFGRAGRHPTRGNTNAVRGWLVLMADNNDPDVLLRVARGLPLPGVTSTEYFIGDGALPAGVWCAVVPARDVDGFWSVACASSQPRWARR